MLDKIGYDYVSVELFLYQFIFCSDIPEWLRHEIYDELPLHHTEPIHHVNPFELLTSSQQHPYEEQVHAAVTTPLKNVDHQQTAPVNDLTARRCSGVDCKYETAGIGDHKTSSTSKLTKHKIHPIKTKSKKQPAHYKSFKQSHDRYNTHKASDHKHQNLQIHTVSDTSKDGRNSFIQRNNGLRKFRNVSLSQMNYLAAKTSLLLHHANRRVNKTRQLAMAADDNNKSDVDDIAASFSARKTATNTNCDKKSCEPTEEARTGDTNSKIVSILTNFYKKQNSHRMKMKPGMSNEQFVF